MSFVLPYQLTEMGKSTVRTLLPKVTDYITDKSPELWRRERMKLGMFHHSYVSLTVIIQSVLMSFRTNLKVLPGM